MMRGMQSLSSRYRTALVTGASSGLGQAFAAMLRREGLEVWATSRRPPDPADPEAARWLAADFADEAGVTRFVETHADLLGRVDLLVNNAGAGVFGPWEDFPPEEIGRQVELLLTAPVRLCRAVYPGMVARRSGAIVNVASLAAEFPLPYLPLYNAAKAGLAGFSRSLLFEAPRHGVAVIDLRPGDYRTGFNQSVRRTEPSAGSAGPVGRVWQRLERNLAAAPPAEHAAEKLRAVLLSGGSGVYRIGGTFQARLAPLLARLASDNLLRRCLTRYFALAE